MIKLHKISDYQSKASDVYFFDTNVWMYLFCPIGNYNIKTQKIYSGFFKEVTSVGACIWINSLVLSEFCNAWLRIEFKQWCESNQTPKADYKKDFIPSETYKETVGEIKEVIQEILKKSERTSDEFSAINIDNVLNELENCDFNDSYYLELAQQKNWKIVTHDADLFKNNKLNIEIITANNKIA